MRITPHDLDTAAKKGLITEDQAQQLWTFWQKQQENTPQFRFTHVMYYFGGLLAISAFSLFITNAWEKLVGAPLLILSLLLFVLGCLLSRYFDTKKLTIPAGLLAVFSLMLVPLVGYNIEYLLGIMPGNQMPFLGHEAGMNWRWVPIEIATLLVGIILLYFNRFAFLAFPIALTLWYMCADLYSLIFYVNNSAWLSTFSLYFGLLVIASAIYIDFKWDENKIGRDYAFWIYLAGVPLFWIGLTSLDTQSELTRALYCLTNLIMIIVSVFLNRRIFTVFGAAGVIIYLGHLAFSLFENSLGFPIALVFLGILIIVGATQWARVEKKLTHHLEAYLPQKMLKRIKR